VSDSRTFEPPPFEQVKSGMREAMAQTRSRELIEKVRSQTKIEFR
jgi:hypothetical protein